MKASGAVFFNFFLIVIAGAIVKATASDLNEPSERYTAKTKNGSKNGSKKSSKGSNGSKSSNGSNGSKGSKKGFVKTLAMVNELLIAQKRFDALDMVNELVNVNAQNPMLNEPAINAILNELMEELVMPNDELIVPMPNVFNDVLNKTLANDKIGTRHTRIAELTFIAVSSIILMLLIFWILRKRRIPTNNKADVLAVI